MSRLHYARRHTFTTLVPLSVTIDHKSAASNASPLDTYLLLIEGHSTNGQGKVLGRNNDSGLTPPDRNARLADIELAPGDYTIEATTNNASATGDYTLTVTATAGGTCITDLGALTAGRHTAAGAVAAAAGCVSAHAGTAASRQHARWHTFTLAAPAWVDIDLAKATSSTLDPYVLLHSGTDVSANGTILARDDSSGVGTAAQIQGRYLQAGTYTIEATASTATGNTATGAYDLTVTVPIHGLPQTINATVDQQTTIGFSYWPATAKITAQSTELLAELSARNGRGSVAATPTEVNSHSVSVLLTTSSNPSSESRPSRQRRNSVAPSTTSTREFTYLLGVDCPESKILSGVNGILCVNPRTQRLPTTLHDDVPEPDSGIAYRGPYLVTPGALKGVRHAAARALNPYSAACNVSVHELTALLLSIGFREVPNKVWVDTNGNGDDDGPVDANGDEFERENARYDARSLMTLSRRDHWWTPVNAGEDNARLYSYYSLTKEPHRAFWHPGVGMWQIDKFNSTDLNHGQRASTRFGAFRVAQVLLNAYCGSSSSPRPEPSLDALTKLMSKQWHACRHLGEDNLCWMTKEEMLLHNDDLFVRVSANLSDDSTSGGALTRNCRWNNQDGSAPTAPVSCYFYDTAYPEGSVHDDLPHGHQSKSRHENWKSKSSPYAAPFVSLNYQGGRFIVFPKSLLPGSTKTLIKRVPINPNLRREDEVEKKFQVRRVSSASWHDRGHFDGLQLEMLICIRRTSSYFPQCQWVSVNADSASAGGSFGTRIAPQRGR